MGEEGLTTGMAQEEETPRRLIKTLNSISYEEANFHSTYGR